MAGVPRAWYQATGFLSALARSDQPECRRLYDDVYRFTKGTYARRATALSAGRPLTLVAGTAGTGGGDLQRLTDGSWDTVGDHPERALQWRGGSACLRLDLGEAHVVSNLRLHLRGPTAVDRVHLALSRDGSAWDAVPVTLALAYDPRAGPGFDVLTFPPRVARWVEVRLAWPADTVVELDEILLPPDGDLLWDSRRRNAAGRVEWVLPAPRVVQTVRIAPVSAATAAAADVRLGQERLDAAAGTVSEGWLEWPLPPRLLETLSVHLPGVPETALRAEAIAAENRALGCPYALSPAAPSTYPDRGGELTDGQLSEAGFGDGRTVGWYDAPPTLFLGAGATAALERLRIHAQGGGYAAVEFPTSVEIATAAADGTWDVLLPRLRPLTFAIAPGAPETCRLGWAEVPLAGVSARQLRIRFLQAGGWTMLSEIEVLRQDRNLAHQAAYQLTPQPTSAARYSDNRGLLTDGALSSGSGWQGCVGWNSGSPEITLDLQAVTPIRLLAVHVVGGGAGAAFLPDRIDVRLSADGIAWSPAGQATCARGESGSEAIPAAMLLILPEPCPARYLRLNLQRHGWAMLHEIEVY